MTMRMVSPGGLQFSDPRIVGPSCSVDLSFEARRARAWLEAWAEVTLAPLEYFFKFGFCFMFLMVYTDRIAA